jgi:hypothetical protein
VLIEKIVFLLQLYKILMSVRFRRSIKVFPGVKINIGKRGISTSVGMRGAHLTFGKNGTYLSTGIPGTGLSQRTKISGSQEHPIQQHDLSAQTSDVIASPPDGPGKHRKIGVLFWLIVGTFVLAIFKNPTLLQVYWGLLPLYVIVRSIARTLQKKKTGGLN